MNESAPTASVTHRRLQELAAEFGIPMEMLMGTERIAYQEAKTLVVAEMSHSGREHLLTPQAADAWTRMQTAAHGDGTDIFIVSAYRSVERQTEIVRRKLASGVPIGQILAVSALPGYSEHHTGRAVDIGTPGAAILDEDFQNTAAYAWLQTHATTFGFRLSYPAGNPEGYIYEPWHWCHHET